MNMPFLLLQNFYSSYTANRFPTWRLTLPIAFFFTITFFIIQPSSTVQASPLHTNVSGTMITNTTWTSADSPYIVDNLTIPANVTLTLSAGVVVKFRYSWSTLDIYGNVVSTGTTENPVVLTSLSDDEYGGDSNGDGSASSPAPGNWGWLHVLDGGQLHLTHALARYGGWSSYYTSYNRIISVDPGGSLSLNQSEVAYSQGYGILVSGGSPSISNSSIHHNGYEGLYINGGSPSISSSSIQQNGSDGIYLYDITAVTLTNNSLISNTGYAVNINFYNRTFNPTLSGNSGTGNSINGIRLAGTMTTTTLLAHANLPYVMDGLIINQGATLTLGAGVVVKFRYNSSTLDIYGNVVSTGTTENPVVLTSLSDDEYGGDSNGDGSASSPAPGNWGWLHVLDGGQLHLTHALARYGGWSSYYTSYNRIISVDPGGSLSLNQSEVAYSQGYGILVSGGSPSISNSSIHHNGYEGLYINGGSPSIISSSIRQNNSHGITLNDLISVTLTNNSLISNTGYAVNINFYNRTFNPTLSDNSGTGNSINGIRLAGTMTTTTLLAHANLPYVMDGLIINQGATLTLGAGVVVKFRYNSSTLDIYGNVVSTGTTENPVVLTSLSDDEYGGDSNGDGSASSPAPGNWGWLHVLDGGQLHLTHALARYGGWSSYYTSYNRIISVDPGGSLSLNQSEVAYSQGYGILVSGGSPSISNSSIHHNGYEGLYINGGSPSIISSSIRQNNSHGITLNDLISVTLTNNSLISNTGYAVNINFYNRTFNPTLSDNSGTGNSINGIRLAGTMTTTTLLAHANLPYVMDGLIINQGATLTLGAGVVVKFRYNSSTLDIYGNVVSTGTTENPVVLTSLSDDEYGGDSNGDGSASSPAPGNWGWLHVLDGGQLHLTHALARYGGWSSYYTSYNRIISVDPGGSLSLNQSEVAYSQGYGILVSGGSPSISNSSIHHNGYEGLYINGGSPSISSSSIQQNGSDGIYLYDITAVTLTNNSLISNTGYAVNINFYNRTFNPTLSDNSGTGNSINGIRLAGTMTTTTLLAHANLPYVMDGLIINQGATLTLGAGVVVKFRYNSSTLDIYGNVVSTGTTENPVVLTSLSDDEYGGDSNGDGSASSPAPGNWGWLHVLDGGQLHLTHALARYGGWSSYYTSYNRIISVDPGGSLSLNQSEVAYSQGYGILVSGGSPSISNSSIHHNGYEGLYINGGSPSIISSSIRQNNSHGITLNDLISVTLTNNSLISNTGYAVNINFYNRTFNPTLSGNSGTGNSINGIRLAGTMTTTTLLAHANLPYVMDGLIINQGATLTLGAGVVVKFRYNSSTLDIYGNVVSTGTTENPVVLTSLSDDEYGGDSNGDGSASSPAPGNWGWLHVLDGGQLHLTHALARYGGWSSYYTSYNRIISVDPGGSLSLNQSEVAYSQGYGILVSGGSPSISNSSIHHNGYEGLYLSDASAKLNGNTIEFNNGSGIVLTNSSNASISNNSIQNNVGSGINNLSDALINARNNWWGDATGPQHSTNPEGLGNAVSDNVLFEPWMIFAPQTAIQTVDLVIDSQQEFTLHPLTPLYVKVSPQVGQNLLLLLEELDSPGTERIVRVLGNPLSIPQTTVSEHSAETTSSTTQVELPISPVSADTYYFMLYAPYLKQGTVNIRLQAHYADLHLSSITPNETANLGTLTTEVLGTGFTSDTIISLVSDAGAIIPMELMLAGNANHLLVRFNVQNLPIGSYHVQAHRSSDNLTVIKDNVISLTNGQPGRLKVRLEGPEAVRPGRLWSYKVSYENVGDAEMPGPFIMVHSTASGVLLLSESISGTNQLTWLAPGDEGGGSTLLPGERGVINFLASTSQPTQLTVTELKDSADSYPWDVVRTALEQPTGSSPVEQSGIWQTIKQQMGSTYTQVHSNLRLVYDGLYARGRESVGFSVNAANQTAILAQDFANEVKDSAINNGRLVKDALILAGQDIQNTADFFVFNAERDMGFDCVAPNLGIVKNCAGVFRGSKHTIILTHGWAGPLSWTIYQGQRLPIVTCSSTEIPGRFQELGKAIKKYDLAHGLDRNIVLVNWVQGSCRTTPWVASTNTVVAGKYIVTKINQLAGGQYANWEQVHYVGESFGNLVNGYASENATAKGTGLLLNVANDLGRADASIYRSIYNILVSSYTAQFRQSIAIQTLNLAADRSPLRLDTGDVTFLYYPPICVNSGEYGLCAWFWKFGLEKNHTTGAPLLACLLQGNTGSTGENYIDCSQIQQNSQLAVNLIDTDYATICASAPPYFCIPYKPGIDGIIHSDGSLSIGEQEIVKAVNEVWNVADYANSTIQNKITEIKSDLLGILWAKLFSFAISLIQSRDPNEIEGPIGIGDQHRLARSEVMNYTIHFENAITATAPVQEIFLINELDPNFDVSTLHFDAIEYSEHVVDLNIPAGTLEFEYQDIPPAQIITGTAEGEFRLNIHVKFDVQRGRAEWYLKLIDTATSDLPADPFAGFLPPEDGTGRGQGYVTYSIKPKAGLASGTVIKNKASIIFDTNEAIATNEVFNTIVDAADLVLATDAPAQAAINTLTVFTYTLYNDGPELASSVTVSGFASSGLPVQSLVASLGSCTTDACVISNLAAGQQAMMTLTLQANTPTVVTTTVSAGGQLLDPNAVDNRSTHLLAVVNHAPLFSTLPVTQVVESNPYTYTVQATDLDLNDAVTVTVPSLPTWLTHTVSLNGTLLITGIPGKADVGDYLVVLQASDRFGASTQQTFTVTVQPLAEQSINFAQLLDKNYGDPAFSITATASSGLPVTFTTQTPSVCAVNNATVTVSEVGTCTIRANQAGNQQFDPAPPVERSFRVKKIDQTISFTLESAKTYGDPAFLITASASSALPVTFASFTNAVCALSNQQISLLAAGNCTIRASQPGNDHYNPAPTVDRSLLVNKASQTITFTLDITKTYGDPAFSISATASSGLPVEIAALAPSICTVNGDQVQILAAGSCNLRAGQAGNNNYNPASDVDRTVPIAQAPQKIVVGQLITKTVGDLAFVYPVSATSGLTVSLTSLTETICTVENEKVRPDAAGVCTIRAAQSGNQNYLAAESVDSSFPVTDIIPGRGTPVITFTLNLTKTYGDSAFTISATSSVELPIYFATQTPQVCTVIDSAVALLGAGICTIRASQPGNDQYNAAQEVDQSFTVNKADQSIDFPVLSDRFLEDGSFVISATASSGLPITLQSNTAELCKVNQQTVELVKVGTCAITAVQAGDANYNAALPVTHEFAVTEKEQRIFLPLVER